MRLRPEHPLLTLGGPQIGNRNKTIWSQLAPDTALVPGSTQSLEYKLTVGPLSPLSAPVPVRSKCSIPVWVAFQRTTMSLRAGARLGFRTCTPTLLRTRTYSAFTQKKIDPQLNGYPQLPNESRQSLPPHGWWDIQMRRNYGDTVLHSFFFLLAFGKSRVLKLFH